jgi:hypothetical protein
MSVEERQGPCDGSHSACSVCRTIRSEVDADIIEKIATWLDGLESCLAYFAPVVTRRRSARPYVSPSRNETPERK